MLPLLLGCTPVSIEQPTVVNDTPPPVEDTAPDTTPADTEPEDTGPESVEGAGSGDAWIFNPAMVHALDITISQDNIDTLNDKSGAYSSETVWVEVDATYDGLPLPSIGMRLKGRWGSWRSFDGKPSIKLDLNRYVDGQDLEGIKSLTFNNMVIDCSFMREHMAYPVYEAMGVPAPRTAHVWMTVNGEGYGLYLNVESIDDVYLERHHDDSEGNLYDADYILWDDGSYTVLDFFTTLSQYFEQEEGEDIGGADLTEIAAMLDALGGTADFYTATADRIDWDHHQRMVAAEMWVGQNDGYSLNRNNYLVYFEPDGPMTIQPWDHDYAFLSASEWGFSWTNPTGRLTNLCLADADCRADQISRIAEVIEVVDEIGYDDRFEFTQDMIAPYIDADQRRECSDSSVGWYQSDLGAWKGTRDDTLRAMWGL
ncbi:MAG: hypothetical protein ACI8RZ_000454 [Myxococcota bacterium]|jgi:hypothetical protein